MERAQGIDISQVNGAFSLEEAKKNGANIAFIILRASLANRPDTQFARSLESAASIPIKGAYHYMTYATPWKIQADRFLKEVEGKDLQFYALDFEKRIDAPKKEADYISKNSGGAGKWMAYVAARTNKPTLFYTNPSTYEEMMRFGQNWMGQWPLWIANFVNAKEPNLPTGVTDWKFWQHSADGNNLGKKYGVGSQHIDLNYFNGTIEALHAWLMTKVEEKSKTLGKAVRIGYTWRDVLNATRQVDDQRFGAWLKKVGVLGAVKNDRSLLAQPYSGPPIKEWPIDPEDRANILLKLNVGVNQMEVNQAAITWRDVIEATKEVDDQRFGAWLKKVGVLGAIKNNRSLLAQTYAGPPIPEWPIDPDKRLAILEQLKKKGVKEKSGAKIQSSQSMLLDVPFISQWDKQEADLHDADCGPTCLAMILRAQGINGGPQARLTTVNQLYQHYLPEILGAGDRKKYTTLGQLKMIGRGEGLDARFNQYHKKKEALAGLQNWISRGQPIIVLINYAKWNPTVQLGFRGRHFVVVTGYDDEHVYIHDPLFPVARKKEGEFYKWTNEVFLEGWGTVHPQGKIPNQNFVYFYTNKKVASR